MVRRLRRAGGAHSRPARAERRRGIVLADVRPRVRRRDRRRPRDLRPAEEGGHGHARPQRRSPRRTRRAERDRAPHGDDGVQAAPVDTSGPRRAQFRYQHRPQGDPRRGRPRRRASRADRRDFADVEFHGVWEGEATVDVRRTHRCRCTCSPCSRSSAPSTGSPTSPPCTAGCSRRSPPTSPSGSREPPRGRSRGRIALITGGGRGIGEDIARDLAAAGMHVVVGAHGRAGRAGRGRDGRARLLGDVSDRSDVERWAAEAGDVDLLVCNAGVLGPEGVARRPRRLVAHVRGQRPRRLPLLPGVRAADARARRGADHHRHERSRVRAQSTVHRRLDGVRREQGGAQPLHRAARRPARAERRVRLPPRPRHGADGDERALPAGHQVGRSHTTPSCALARGVRRARGAPSPRDQRRAGAASAAAWRRSSAEDLNAIRLRA